MNIEIIGDKVTVEMPNDGAKYLVEVKPGVFVDVYDFLNAFKVSDHGYAHAIKKMLNVGKRGHKDERQDRDDILESVTKSNIRYELFNK